MSTLQIRDKLTGIVKIEGQMSGGTTASQKDRYALCLAEDIGIVLKDGLYGLDDLYITEIGIDGTCINKWDFESLCC
jgi:hypothetical protein